MIPRKGELPATLLLPLERAGVPAFVEGVPARKRGLLLVLLVCSPSSFISTSEDGKSRAGGEDIVVQKEESSRVASRKLVTVVPGLDSHHGAATTMTVFASLENITTSSSIEGLEPIQQYYVAKIRDGVSILLKSFTATDDSDHDRSTKSNASVACRGASWILVQK